MNDIVINLASPIPVYEQIRSQVTAAVAVGSLGSGDRLPASRDLARDLGIAVGTVQRAYKELEISGVVESKRRTGTVIVGNTTATDLQTESAAAPTKIVHQAKSLVTAARRAGVDDDSLIDILRGAIATA